MFEEERVTTPFSLVEKLNFQNRHFESVHDFTKYINQVTREYRVPYSSETTGNSRTYQKFTCRFGGRVTSNYGNSSKLGCPSYIKYIKIGNNYSLAQSNFEHNHTLDPLYIEGHTNCNSEETIQKINFEQKLSVPPWQIRHHNNVSSSTDIFYNLRRKTIILEKKETLDELIDYLKKSNFKSLIRRNNFTDV